MSNTFISTTSTTVNAPASKVWDALTNPNLIKQYLLGTQVICDWQVGSPIIYKGEWQGKSYQDKGEILQVEPEKLLVSTFWSSLSGLPDTPKNYKTVRYEMTTEGDKIKLTLTQDNNATQEDANHSDEFWNKVLDTLKKLVEV